MSGVGKSPEAIVNSLAMLSINFPMFYMSPCFCISFKTHKKVTLIGNPASTVKK